MAVQKPGEVHEKFEDHSKLFRDLLLGFVKVHVLHHASREPIYGVGIGVELDRHGYHLSPGTLYPLLHNLESTGFLDRNDRIVEGKIRKYYEITRLGRIALEESRRKIVELVDEIMKGEPNGPTASTGSRSPRRGRSAR